MTPRLSDFRYIALTARAVAASEKAQRERPYPWRAAGIESFRAELDMTRETCEQRGWIEFYRRAIQYGTTTTR